MKRKTRILLTGLASVGGVAAAGMAHNRRPDRRELLHATVFSEPGYRGRNQMLTWNGGKHEVVPLNRVQLPRIGSITLDRLVYRFKPDVRLPNMRFLWHALTERPDRTDPESGVASFIAMHELVGMFSMGWWEPVRESKARSGVRLWAGRPGDPPPAHDKGGLSGKAAPGEAATPGVQPWHDVLSNTSDLGSWGARTRYLELGYHDGSTPRG
ncbi:hypothetical protein [Streptomyces rapamycinicus]|nr:hypothetical protein [Streptomyces rapamycinicus]AGP59568.1 hypothetical protein M271_40955 [Streptomyces rapamycinicus NRRL 5491]MBB4789283.1 hypothetical protein [Streptomyces rapamycinicus]UTO67266.1 hypothetical protein LJB45_36515 [Streptomyces rapamycinicus]UTP35224.1 hypothetical protein LIV37_41650 [Streptomyces rapamycinicus NRRL 5491]